MIKVCYGSGHCMNYNSTFHTQHGITLEKKPAEEQLKLAANENQPCYQQMTSPAMSTPARQCHSADRIQRGMLTSGADEIPSVHFDQIWLLIFCRLCIFTIWTAWCHLQKWWISCWLPYPRASDSSDDFEPFWHYISSCVCGGVTGVSLSQHASDEIQYS